MKVRLSALIAAVVAALLIASGAPAGDEQATRYYLSLGDSLAAGSGRGGDVDDYPEQLFDALPYQARWSNKGEAPSTAYPTDPDDPWLPLFDVPGEPVID